MADLRWAVMGTGLIARVLERIEAAEGCAVTAVASRDAARARAFADRFGRSDLGAVTYDELLDRSDVDAVYLALPNHLHVPWSIRLLRAGKHVLCEKPLAACPDEARRAFGEAERAGRLLAEGFMYMHHPQTDRLIELARAGDAPGSAIGPLRMVRADRGWDLRGGPTVNTRWSHAMQGGALMDLGCYPVGLVRWLLGEEPEAARAVARLEAPLAGEAAGVDGSLCWQLAFPSGVLAGGACSMVESGVGSLLELVGEWGIARTTWPYAPDPDRAVVSVERNERHPDGAGSSQVVVEGAGDKAEAQFAAFARAVRGEAEAVPGGAWSIGQAATIRSLLLDAGVRFGASPDP